VCEKVSRYRSSQLVGAVGGQRVSDLVGELEHGVRAQAAVQVVVQGHLGCAGDDLEGCHG
jgi:hypothetical protein